MSDRHNFLLSLSGGAKSVPSEGVFSLQDLAEHLSPRTFWFWYRADDYLSDWQTSASEDRDREIQVAPRRWDMERRRAALYRRLTDRVRHVLSSNQCTIQGVGPTGAEVEMSQARIAQLEIDLPNNVLRTRGGGMRWEAVQVTVYRPQVPDAQPRKAGRATAAPPRVDRKDKQREVLAALKEIFGDDIPTGKGSSGPVSIDKMKARLSKKGRTAGADTILRSLGRKD